MPEDKPENTEKDQISESIPDWLKVPAQVTTTVNIPEKETTTPLDTVETEKKDTSEDTISDTPLTEILQDTIENTEKPQENDSVPDWLKVAIQPPPTIEASTNIPEATSIESDIETEEIEEKVESSEISNTQ